MIITSVSSKKVSFSNLKFVVSFVFPKDELLLTCVSVLQFVACS